MLFLEPLDSPETYSKDFKKAFQNFEDNKEEIKKRIDEELESKLKHVEEEATKFLNVLLSSTKG